MVMSRLQVASTNRAKYVPLRSAKFLGVPSCSSFLVSALRLRLAGDGPISGSQGAHKAHCRGAAQAHPHSRSIRPTAHMEVHNGFSFLCHILAINERESARGPGRIERNGPMT